MRTNSKSDHRRGVLIIVAIYALSGGLWIYCTDTILAWLVQDPAILTRLAIFKGIVFIALTSSMLFVLINRFIRQREQSFDELHAIIQTTQDGFYITDMTGRILEVNDAYCKMSGYTRDELLSMGVPDLEAIERPEEVTAHIARIMTSGTDCFESQHRCKDGRIIDIETSVTFLQNLDGRLYCFIRDITERKRVDDMLRLKEFTLGNIFNAIYWLTPDAKFWDVNEAAEKLLGYTHEQFLCMSVFDIDPIFTAERWPSHWEELKRTGSLQFETINRTRDGHDIPVEITANYCRYNDREYNCAIVRDITERRILQDERIKGQKLESLGVLAGGIAHDFNNILTGIMGNVSFARTFIDESHRSSKILEQAEKASQRAADLAHQLLTFAKGGQPIKKTVSARQIIEASASLVLHGSNVVSAITIPDSLYAIDADEGQISQAFNNIIINAVQAMPDGGTITISAENVTLDSANMMSLAAGKYIKITFTDTGCGISPEEQQKIFDPYFTTKPSGNGLGLASVYSIISKHDGHISVRSMVGRGTTFYILLPAANRNITETEADTTAVKTGEHYTLLVMDDEELIRNLASDMLADQGYHVQTCSNGDEAVALYTAAKAAGVPFSAVIMDLTIPGGMGGKEAAQHILRIDPQACLVVSSGYSNDPVMADYARFGFCSTIVKPYSLTEIAQVLSGLLK
ncbi:MAG: PAS domain S-box protein [Verrucomicrobia bacterium]|nr:PAS domain S-box protein [Deltaproteobacteria bacterium]